MKVLQTVEYPDDTDSTSQVSEAATVVAPETANDILDAPAAELAMCVAIETNAVVPVVSVTVGFVPGLPDRLAV